MSTFLPFWGSKCGAVVRALSSHQSGPGFKSQCQHHMWLSLSFVLSLAPRSFSPGSPVFLVLKNQHFQNSNSTSNQVDEGPQSGYVTSKSLFILLIHSFIGSLLVYLFTLLSFLFFHHQAQKKERSTNVQKRIQASFSKLTM